MALTKVTNRLIDGSPANVNDFGADPTGTSDSTAAFTAALAASSNIYVPSGTYLIDDQIDLEDDTNICIFGDSSGIAGENFDEWYYTSGDGSSTAQWTKSGTIA